VLPVASALGISLDEVLASFATVTIAGIKTSEATTQLRGSLNALLKPTKATKELLAELGFTSGEALIQARGLQGAFLAMKEAAGGSITELSKFVPRVRGLNAVLIVAGSGADRFQETLRKIRDESKGLLAQQFQVVIESNAEEVANTVNRLTNLFTVELGNSILETLARFTRLIGGVDTLGAALKTLAPIAIVGTVALVGIAAGIFAFNSIAIAATATATALGVSIAALATVAGGALAPLLLFAALSFAENSRVAAIRAELEAIKARNTQELELEKKQNAATIALRNARSRELNAVLQGELAEFNKTFQKRIAGNRSANDAIVADNKRVVTAITSAGEAIIKATQKRVTTEQSIQAAGIAAQKAAIQSLSDFEFDTRNKNLSQIQQFSNLQQRANVQLAEAAKLTQAASAADTTKDDIASARAALDRAQATAQEAQSVAESLGNRTASAQIENTIRGILQQKLTAERQITQASAQREAIEVARLTRQRTELANIKDLAQAVLNAPSLFEDGEALTGDAQAAAVQSRSDALSAFRSALGASKELSIDQIIDFSALSSNLDAQLTQADIQGLSVSSEAFTSLRASINENLAGFRAKFGAEITTLEIAQDIKIENPAQLSAALTQQLKLEQQTLQVDADLTQQIAAVSKEIRVVAATLDLIQPASDNAFAAVGLGISLFGDLIQDAEGETEGFVTLLGEINKQLVPLAENFKQTGTLTDEQIQKVTNLSNAFKTLGGTAAAPLGAGEATDITDKLLTSLNDVALKVAEVNALQAQAAADGGTAAALEKNKAFSEAAEQAAGQEADARRRAAEGASRTATEAQKTVTSTQAVATNTNNAVAATQAIAQAWTVAAAGSERVRAAAGASSGSPITARIGRSLPRFLSGGGFAARGTDTIPAMLSPGEFVVNARSSKRFFSQLQSMNAGRQPVYRQDGGPVTNVGDINVSVGNSQEAGTTGRTIARSIRRELRRGTSTL
jgi:hypothetical protein